jgi:hypothetical protein
VDAAPRGGLASRGFAGVVAANAALGMVFGALQVSVTAFATDHDAAGLAGPLYSVMNLACLASAALYGRRPRTLTLRTALALLAVASMPLLVVVTPAALAVALVAPGLAIAPILAPVERGHPAARARVGADPGIHVAELGERGGVGRGGGSGGPGR